MTESFIIKTIAEKLNCQDRSKGFGPFGDDAYLVPSFTSAETLVQSTDAFVEGTHFTTDMSYDSVGWKSLTSSLSDVYAMGAHPSFYSLNLIVPSEFNEKDLESFLGGLSRASLDYDVSLLGGDVSRGKVFSVVVQASGFMLKDHVKTNSGAVKGDVIVTNKEPGRALLGLQQFQSKDHEGSFVNDFLYPKPDKNLGPWLSQFNEVTSLTDISDGLYRELKNLCDMTSTSVMIENLPMTLPFKEACQKLNQDPFITSLQGGEEYSLLWTVKPDFLQDFLKKYQIQFKKKPFLIGRVQSNKSKRQIVYENQDLIESIKPFEHFES